MKIHFEKSHSPNGRRWDDVLNAGVALGLALVAACCLYGWRVGIFNDLATLRAYVGRAGVFAPLFFMLLHLLQIIVPFIPGGVVATAGVVVFGAWLGFLLNYLGTALGSTISFTLARHYGKDFVRRKIDPQVWRKYFRWLDNERLFPWLFAVMILLPFAPDDALCMLAGISGISRLHFLLCILLCKIPTLLLYSLAMLGADTLL